MLKEFEKFSKIVTFGLIFFAAVSARADTELDPKKNIQCLPNRTHLELHRETETAISTPIQIKLQKTGKESALSAYFVQGNDLKKILATTIEIHKITSVRRGALPEDWFGFSKPAEYEMVALHATIKSSSQEICSIVDGCIVVAAKEFEVDTLCRLSDDGSSFYSF